jgi:hypothetical protein
MNAVVRENALDLAEGKYRVDFLMHLAGRLNTVADVLSRFHQPGASTTLPAELTVCRRVSPPLRDLTWWETAGPPL